MKKLIMLGTATSIYPIDWNNKDIEIWGLGTCFSHPDIKRIDIGFELHAPEKIEDIQIKKGTNFRKFKNIPIYVQDQYNLIIQKYMDNPVSFPLKDVLDYVEKEGLHKYFTCSFSYLLVYAIMKGYTDIEIRKVSLSTDQEYVFERPNIVYWCNTLGRKYNVTIHIPDDSFINNETMLYGYEEQNKKHLAMARSKYLWNDFNRTFEIYSQKMFDYSRLIGIKDLTIEAAKQSNTKPKIKDIEKKITDLSVEIQQLREHLFLVQGCIQSETFYNELIR
jgi:hypothetical protein